MIPVNINDPSPYSGSAKCLITANPIHMFKKEYKKTLKNGSLQGLGKRQ
jgi:hypothetical protein